MKFKAPDNCNEISVGGEIFRVDTDGNIVVPDNGNYESLLIPHGFTVAKSEDTVKVAKKEKIEDTPVKENIVAAPWNK